MISQLLLVLLPPREKYFWVIWMPRSLFLVVYHSHHKREAIRTWWCFIFIDSLVCSVTTTIQLQGTQIDRRVSIYTCADVTFINMDAEHEVVWHSSSGLTSLFHFVLQKCCSSPKNMEAKVWNKERAYSKTVPLISIYYCNHQKSGRNSTVINIINLYFIYWQTIWASIFTRLLLRSCEQSGTPLLWTSQ